MHVFYSLNCLKVEEPINGKPLFREFVEVNVRTYLVALHARNREGIISLDQGKKQTFFEKLSNHELLNNYEPLGYFFSKFRF